jgi:hypothetical protein
VKKRFIIALASLFVVLLLAFAFWYFYTPVFNMVIPLPDFPESIQVYRMVDPDVTFEKVAGIGTKLGMTGEISERDDSFVMNDHRTGAHLVVFKATGAFQYDIASALYPEETPVLPSFEEAGLIATDYLSERGWLAGGVELNEVVVGGTMGNGTPAHLLVRFDYPIDGYKFAANKYSLRIGHGGEVVSVFINPVKYDFARMAALKPVKQAYRELKATRGKFAGVSKLWVSIDDVYVAYWLDGVMRAQDYIYPVYVFMGHSYPGHNDFTGWVEATDESSIGFPAVN